MLRLQDLTPTDVFVFGSNEQGFHGAGSAGLAMRGDARNTWRTDPHFLQAMRSAPGSPLRVGLRAIYGEARGLQQGSQGPGWAVATVTRPGAKRSVSRREIYYQLVRLWGWAELHPGLTVHVTPVGQGYAGWTAEEMAEVWRWLLQQHGHPANVKLHFSVGENVPDQAT